MYFKFINIIGWGKCNPQVEVVDRKRCNLISIPEDAVRSARSLKESFQISQDQFPKVFQVKNGLFAEFFSWKIKSFGLEATLKLKGDCITTDFD